MSKMIKTSELRVALGFLYPRSMNLFLVKHGFATMREVRGVEKFKVQPEIPASAIPKMIREREDYVRKENPWRQQAEFDLLWFEAYRLGVPVTDEWPERIRHVVAQYPDGMTLPDLIKELGFTRPPTDWKPSPKNRPWVAERQLSSWLHETGAASDILKMYPR
jgi:hypothetical protein